MLKIAVCDDNSFFLNQFYNHLVNKYGEYIDELDLYDSSKIFYNTNKVYDIIFLDIEMPYMDGITFSNKYDKSAIIVFVTCKEHLVFRAYNDTISFGFIRKRNLKTDLDIVMSKFFQNNFNKQTISVQISSSQIEKVMCKEILYIEKYVNNIIIHTIKGEYVERNTLGKILNKLDNSVFVRCHIGYIINIDFVISFKKDFVVLQGNETIPVSRKNINIIKETLLIRGNNNWLIH